MKDIGKSDRVQNSENVWGIGGLHLVGVGDGPLQHDGSSCGQNHHED